MLQVQEGWIMQMPCLINQMKNSILNHGQYELVWRAQVLVKASFFAWKTNWENLKLDYLRRRGWQLPKKHKKCFLGKENEEKDESSSFTARQHQGIGSWSMPFQVQRVGTLLTMGRMASPLEESKKRPGGAVSSCAFCIRNKRASEDYRCLFHQQKNFNIWTYSKI